MKLLLFLNGFCVRSWCDSWHACVLVYATVCRCVWMGINICVFDCALCICVCFWVLLSHEKGLWNEIECGGTSWFDRRAQIALLTKDLKEEDVAIKTLKAWKIVRFVFHLLFTNNYVQLFCLFFIIAINLYTEFSYKKWMFEVILLEHINHQHIHCDITH